MRERVYQAALILSIGVCLWGAVDRADKIAEIDRLKDRNAEYREKNIAMEGNIDRLVFELREMTNSRNTLAGENERLAVTVEQLREVLDAESNSEIIFEYAGEFFCTAYCCEKYPHICGAGTGFTASGAPVQAGVSVAVSQADLPQMPFGTAVYIEGVGVRIVQDTGGMGAKHLDVALPTHEEALRWSEQGKHRVFMIKGGN